MTKQQLQAPGSIENDAPRGRTRRCAARVAGRRLAPPLVQACMLVCMLAPTAARAQAAQVVQARIAGQEAMAPKWVHLRNRVTGICPDLLAAIERVEPRLRFVGSRQSRSLPAIEAGLDAGNLDVACALASSTRWRAVAAPVGPEVYLIRHRLLARGNDRAEVHSTADLVRLHALVVGQRGATFTERLRAAGVQVDDATDDNMVNLHKVLAGHGRFVEMNDLTLRHYLRNEDLGARVRILPDVLAEEPAYFWVGHKADPAIARLLGPALDKLKASGELERIYARRAANP